MYQFPHRGVNLHFHLNISFLAASAQVHALYKPGNLLERRAAILLDVLKLVLGRPGFCVGDSAFAHSRHSTTESKRETHREASG